MDKLPLQGKTGLCTHRKVTQFGWNKAGKSTNIFVGVILIQASSICHGNGDRTTARLSRHRSSEVTCSDGITLLILACIA
jgi:hypothetical protein